MCLLRMVQYVHSDTDNQQETRQEMLLRLSRTLNRILPAMMGLRRLGISLSAMGNALGHASDYCHPVRFTSHPAIRMCVLAFGFVGSRSCLAASKATAARLGDIIVAH